MASIAIEDILSGAVTEIAESTFNVTESSIEASIPADMEALATKINVDIPEVTTTSIKSVIADMDSSSLFGKAYRGTYVADVESEAGLASIQTSAKSSLLEATGGNISDATSSQLSTAIQDSVEAKATAAAVERGEELGSVFENAGMEVDPDFMSKNFSDPSAIADEISVDTTNSLGSDSSLKTWVSKNFSSLDSWFSSVDTSTARKVFVWLIKAAGGAIALAVLAQVLMSLGSAVTKYVSYAEKAVENITGATTNALTKWGIPIIIAILIIALAFWLFTKLRTSNTTPSQQVSQRGTTKET